MLLDTGSPDLWVYSEQGCQKSQQCPPRDSYYKEGLSKDYKEHPELGEFLASFALGAVQGELAEDRVCLGRNDTGDATTGSSGCIANPIKFLKVNNATQMDNYQCSGFVGLAPKTSMDGY